jgi:hypothetical protein
MDQLQRGERQQGGNRDGRNPGYSALNDGNLRAPNGGPPQELNRGIDNVYREGIRDLNQMRQALAGEDADTAKEVQDLIRQMQRLDPSRFPGNPAMLEQMRAEVLPNIQQLEIQLRRKLDEKQGGQVRTVVGDSIPSGYAEAVAEYFRKLSKGK